MFLYIPTMRKIKIEFLHGPYDWAEFDWVLRTEWNSPIAGYQWERQYNWLFFAIVISSTIEFDLV